MDELRDVFPDDLPDESPPRRDIEHNRTWGTVIPTTKFAFNSSIDRSTSLSPYEVDTVYKPGKPIDLVPMSLSHRASGPAESFALHIHSWHQEIRQKITTSNEHYKFSANQHKRFKEFNVGDSVMVRIRPERYPPWAIRKLHARNAGPFKIIKRNSLNVYEVDLSPSMGITSTFDVDDLLTFQGTTDTLIGHSPTHPDFLDLSLDPWPPLDPFSQPLPPIHTLPDPFSQPLRPIPTRPDLFSQPLPPIPNLHTPREEIEDILDHQIVSTSNGRFQKHLVKWKLRPASNSMWLTEEELQILDPDILERFRSFISPVAKSSQPGRIDEDITRTHARTMPLMHIRQKEDPIVDLDR
ncbi:uncharacterized protein LOC131221208 [Magnolia sinica]|uniref:uncharacterized protein LOC131221208 n=1 Tax=Magnolia sinica TaxID=86752 RepID=UPI00265966F5|nr:uncharacterized protein LOC131221208 [Magnolia sinica]